MTNILSFPSHIKPKQEQARVSHGLQRSRRKATTWVSVCSLIIVPSAARAVHKVSLTDRCFEAVKCPCSWRAATPCWPKAISECRHSCSSYTVKHQPQFCPGQAKPHHFGTRDPAPLSSWCQKVRPISKFGLVPADVMGFHTVYR